MGKQIRLDKFLTEMGKGSRSQVKEAVKRGRIQINGVTEKKPERKLDPDTDRVTFDGSEVAYQAYEYFMLNKPQGVVSATEDSLHKTVTELIPDAVRKDLFPVGRLDIDTEGLLLITNDGALAHRLLAPGKHVDKQYYARVSGTLPTDCKERMAAGLTLSDGTPTRPARLEILREQPDQNEVLLTIHEGKFHQVKRMFEAVGCQVTYLKRLSMGTLTLDEALQPGASRRLTEAELAALRALTETI